MPSSEDEIEGELVSHDQRKRQGDRRIWTPLRPSNDVEGDCQTIGASNSAATLATKRGPGSAPSSKATSMAKARASTTGKLNAQIGRSDEVQKTTEDCGSVKPVPKLPRELQKLAASKFGVMTAVQRGLQMPDPLLRSGRLRRPSSPTHRRRRSGAPAADLSIASAKDDLGSLSFVDQTFDMATTEAHSIVTLLRERPQERRPEMKPREDSYLFSDEEG